MTFLQRNVPCPERVNCLNDPRWAAEHQQHQEAGRRSRHADPLALKLNASACRGPCIVGDRQRAHRLPRCWFPRRRIGLPPNAIDDYYPSVIPAQLDLAHHLTGGIVAFSPRVLSFLGAKSRRKTRTNPTQRAAHPSPPCWACRSWNPQLMMVTWLLGTELAVFVAQREEAWPLVDRRPTYCTYS